MVRIITTKNCNGEMHQKKGISKGKRNPRLEKILLFGILEDMRWRLPKVKHTT